MAKKEVKLDVLLSKAFEDEGVAEEEYALLEREYGQALNNGDCPCGSKMKFEDCCKVSWNALVRGRNRKLRESKENVKQEKRDEKYKGDQTEWLAKVGVNPDGSPAVMPLNENVPTTEFKMAGLLLAAYHSLIVDGTLMNIQAAMRTVFRELTSGPK